MYAVYFWVHGNMCRAGIGKYCRRERRSRFCFIKPDFCFYHELGHAVIDTMQVPIFGQEEDAADVFSILLIDEIFEPESANIIAYDAAFGFHAEAQKIHLHFGMCTGQTNSVITIWFVSLMALIPIFERSSPKNWGFKKSERSVVQMNMNRPSTAGEAYYKTWRVVRASCV